MMMSGVFGLIGVLLGWGLNQLTRYFDHRPKLEYVFVYDSEMSENSAYSGYIIEIINTGKSLVILRDIKLFYKGKDIICCVPYADQRKIAPNESKYYKMTKYDIVKLKKKLKNNWGRFDVIANCIDGKRIHGKLDIIDF